MIKQPPPFVPFCNRALLTSGRVPTCYRRILIEPPAWRSQRVGKVNGHLSIWLQQRRKMAISFPSCLAAMGDVHPLVGWGCKNFIIASKRTCLLV